MKNHLIILLTMISTVYSYAQNSEVDRRSGFKDMKLGIPFSHFDGITELPSNDPNRIVGIWKTSDNDIGYLFDDKIDFFELTFDKTTEELIAIKVNLWIKKPYTDKSTINKFDEIAKKLIVGLGSPDKTMKEILGLIWIGNETSMSLMYNPEKMDVDDYGNIIGTTSIKLIILSNNAFKDDIKNGF